MEHTNTTAPASYARDFKFRIINELAEDFGSIGLDKINEIADEAINLQFNGRLDTGSQVVAHARNCAAVWVD